MAIKTTLVIDGNEVMTKRTPQVGDKVLIIDCGECPDANGKVGTIIDTTYFDDSGETDFDVDIPSVIYGEFTYVDGLTDVFKYVESSETDVVNSPAHYKRGKFETIEVIEHITSGYSDPFVAYCVGNSVKYADRAPYKHDSPATDLRKAAWYLTRAADYLDGKGAID